MKPTYEELESNLAALAAENALLKKSEPAPFSKLMMEALDVYQAGADEVPELAMLSAYKKLRDGLKTPATDAFLAEVRAQESSPLVRALTVIANSEQHDGETVMCDFDTLISVAAGALRDHYAAQLRKGVQS
ncbi:hypothetical protein [Enterobacter cancerogenus]|uniref:hypothetical protein n=1 Tax=Enterobacter cancerogenus TaxID=69218 RepID=UPI0040582CF4